MNYTQYLQGGDSIQAPMSDEQTLAIQKQKDAQAAEAIKSNPSILDKAIQDYGEDAPAFIKHMIDVAAENQDEQLLEILKPYAEKFNISAFRCGGKVRAKVKKAKCGKKMEKGGETPIKKEAKGGKPCPCTLHKVGGKLIEVDCNGIPVAKNGAVLYAKPGNQLPPATASEGVKNYMTAKPISKAMTFSDQWFGDLGKAFVNKMNNWQQNLQQKNPDFWGASASVKKEVTSNEPVVESPEWLAQQRKNQQAHYQTPEGQAEAEAARKAQEEAARIAAIRERNTFGAGKQGKFGGLTYDEALARQNEMLAAKDQGFNVDLGRWGTDGKWGNQSRSEWERYQQWKADQELAALKTQNSRLQRIKPAALNPTRITVDNSTATAPLAVTRNGDIVRTSSLTPGQALSQLNTPAWEEYTRRLRQGILSSKNGGKMSYADYLK